MEQLLALPVVDKRKLNKLKRMGLDEEDVNNKMMITVGLFTAASYGDVAAVKEILKLIGEDQPQANVAEQNVAEYMSALREAVKDGD